MAFYPEPPYYKKTILSDLQGAWELLRDAVVDEHETKDCSLLLFHIDEAMSWESVRNLEHMKTTFILIQNYAQQIRVTDQTAQLIEDVRELLYDVLSELQQGTVR